MAEQNADPEHHSSDSAHPNHPAGGIKPTHMEVIRTAIDGPVIIEPRIFRDDRGYFFESRTTKAGRATGSSEGCISRSRPSRRRSSFA